MKTLPVLLRALRGFSVSVILAASCSDQQPPAAPPTGDVELRGPLEQRALLQSEYSR